MHYLLTNVWEICKWTALTILIRPIHVLKNFYYRKHVFVFIFKKNRTALDLCDLCSILSGYCGPFTFWFLFINICFFFVSINSQFCLSTKTWIISEHNVLHLLLHRFYTPTFYPKTSRQFFLCFYFIELMSLLKI